MDQKTNKKIINDPVEYNNVEGSLNQLFLNHDKDLDEEA